MSTPVLTQGRRQTKDVAPKARANHNGYQLPMRIWLMPRADP